MSNIDIEEAVAKLAEIGNTGVNPSLAEPRRPPTQEELDQTPLFMKSLPDNYEDNETIQALQSLAFEGTPDEVASQFKEQGNDYFKGKRYKEAIQFYTQAIDANPTDKALLESIYSNRAASNLELQNFRQTLRDTSETLKINPRNTKALYRAARALNALEKYDEATDAVKHVLLLDPENKQAQVLIQHIKTKYQAQLKRKIEVTESQRRKNESMAALRDAIEVSILVTKSSSLIISTIALRCDCQRRHLQKRPSSKIRYKLLRRIIKGFNTTFPTKHLVSTLTNYSNSIPS